MNILKALHFLGWDCYPTLTPQSSVLPVLPTSNPARGGIGVDLTRKHLLVACRTGAGKSTLLKAFLREIHNGQTVIKIIDPKTTNWLNLHKLNCVKYISSLGDVACFIEDTFSTLQERKSSYQKTILANKKAPNFPCAYLIIDEWFSVHDGIKREKLLYNNLMPKLNEILAQGRELNVFLILVGQSHLCTEIGFSSAMRQSFTPIALGSRSSSFEPLKALASDANVFHSKKDRDKIGYELEQAITQVGGNRLLLTDLNGMPKLHVLPDLSWVHQIDLAPTSALRESAPEAGSDREVSTSGFAFQPGSEAGSNEFDAQKALSRAIALMIESGVSHTRIIEQVLGFKGRKFNKGRQIFSELAGKYKEKL